MAINTDFFQSALDQLRDPIRTQMFKVIIDSNALTSYKSEFSDMGISVDDINKASLICHSTTLPGIDIQTADVPFMGYNQKYATQTRMTQTMPVSVMETEDLFAYKFFIWWNQKVQKSNILKVTDTPTDSDDTSHPFPQTHIAGLGTQKAGGRGLIRNDGLISVNIYRWSSPTGSGDVTETESSSIPPIIRLNLINAYPTNIGTVSLDHATAGLLKFNITFTFDRFQFVIPKSSDSFSAPEKWQH